MVKRWRRNAKERKGKSVDGGEMVSAYCFVVLLILATAL